MTEPIDLRAAVPELETKLRRPSPSLPLVIRPRLMDRLSAWLDRRLILVSAPAGYGKTALISQWLERVMNYSEASHMWGRRLLEPPHMGVMRLKPVMILARFTLVFKSS